MAEQTVTAPDATAPTPGDGGVRVTPRTTGPWATPRGRRRYFLVLGSLAGLALLIAYGLLAWQNPLPVGSAGFWRIAKLRATSLVIIIVVAFCQATATVAFHTVTNNRIITPSIMGFESLYRVVQTGAVFLFGIAGATMVQGLGQFIGQVAVMVAFSALLYGWLLTGKYANLHIMLLVGIILGGGLGSLATFMQRMLTPTEFDVLTARLIGSISNADATYLGFSVPLVAVAGGLIWLGARRLNVVALGREASVNVGLEHRRYLIVVLLLVSVLMAVSTSLVGPMTFFGFLVAMVSYQLSDTHDHRFTFPMAWLTGIVTLGGAYFVLKNIFYAQGAVGIIIEIVGGTFFLVYVLRKGRL